jgi:hypothetical protein
MFTDVSGTDPWSGKYVLFDHHARDVGSTTRGASGWSGVFSSTATSPALQVIHCWTQVIIELLPAKAVEVLEAWSTGWDRVPQADARIVGSAATSVRRYPQ